MKAKKSVKEKKPSKSAKTAPKKTKPVKPAKTPTKKEVAAKKETTSFDIAVADKQSIIHIFALKEGDTGSPEVQVALATQKITNLVSHLEGNPKDNHSRRGLLKVVAKRRRVLNYLQKKDEKRYTNLIKKLGLKK